MKKYKLTKNKRDFYGITLFQIEATASFGNVVEGELGGSNCLQKPYNIHRNRLKTLAFYY